MDDPRALISGEQIEEVSGTSNFGETPKRSALNSAVLQTACGLTTGFTVRCMMEDLGLVPQPRAGRPRAAVPRLTKKGKQYLWACYGRRSF